HTRFSRDWSSDVCSSDLLLFLLLLGCSLWLTVNHYSFHKSKFINSSNAISGTVYSQTSSVSDYFRLKKDNEALYEENLRLKKLRSEERRVGKEGKSRGRA